MQLTDGQSSAIHSWKEGNICVVAGPGSGKTSVLVERIRWLMTKKGVAPERILAITFTVKAAHEMKDRLLKGMGETQAMPNEPHISTIDSFCSTLLRENPLQAGVEPGFHMLSETEGETLLREAITTVLKEVFGEHREDFQQFFAPLEHLARPTFGSNTLQLTDNLLSVVRQIRSHGANPSLKDPSIDWEGIFDSLVELSIACPNHLSEHIKTLRETRIRGGNIHGFDPVALKAAVYEGISLCSNRGKQKKIKDKLFPAAAHFVSLKQRTWLLCVVDTILAHFQKAKTSARLDFEDALQKATELLKKGPVKLHFEHVLIDEFQDTNPLQDLLMQSLDHAHERQELPRPVRFVVGDRNQSIYGFRHADPEVFSRYREQVKKEKGKVIRLQDNFRSRPELLDVVDSLLIQSEKPGIEPHLFKPGSKSFPKKDLPSVEFHVLTNTKEENEDSKSDPPTISAEARLLAGRLHKLQKSLLIAKKDQEAPSTPQWSDFAVLVRTGNLANQFTNELRTCGIPTQLEAPRQLLETPQAAELSALLHILRNPRDEIHLATLLKSAFCGLDDRDLLALRHELQDSTDNNLARALYEGFQIDNVLEGTARDRMTRFRELYHSWRMSSATTPAHVLLCRAVATCGYRTYLSKQDDPLHAEANLNGFIEFVASLENSERTSIDTICEALISHLEWNAKLTSPNAESDQSSVHIMTMHAAKGLEFPVVVLPSLQSRPSGNSTNLLFSPEEGIGATWLTGIGGTKDNKLPDMAFQNIDEKSKTEEQAERQRLLYVAMTRAEEHLVMSATFGRKAGNFGWCKTLFETGPAFLQETDAGNPEILQLPSGKCLYTHTNLETTNLPAWASTSGTEVTTASRKEPPTTILKPLPPKAQTDFMASVSAITAFAECPRKYFLSYYLNIKPGSTDDPAPESAEEPTGTQFGSDVHHYLAGTLPQNRWTPSIENMANKFLHHELGQRKGQATWHEQEYGLAFTVEDLMLKGVVDLLFKEGGERILVDYKTNTLKNGNGEHLTKIYAPQLQLYALALKEAGKPVDRAILFFLREGLPVDVDISTAGQEHVRGIVTQFQNAQETNNYPMTITPHCQSCPYYKKECPAGKEYAQSAQA